MENKRFSDQLRDAVRTSGMTRYRIAEMTGVPQSVLSRFVNGKGGLSLESIDRLAEALGLTVKSRKPSTRRD